MFAYRIHSVSASVLLSLASLLGWAMPVSAQGRGTNSPASSSQSYQQLQQQLRKDQQILQQQEQWLQLLMQQQLYQQQMMQNWYQQQIFQQQMMQQWQMQRNSPAFSQNAPTTQVKRPR